MRVLQVNKIKTTTLIGITAVATEEQDKNKEANDPLKYRIFFEIA
jgi:hypothetical protein